MWYRNIPYHVYMYIPDSFRDDVENLKKEGKFEQALKKVNHILMSAPTDEWALLQVVDIEYRRGELIRGRKAYWFPYAHEKRWSNALIHKRRPWDGEE